LYPKGARIVGLKYQHKVVYGEGDNLELVENEVEASFCFFFETTDTNGQFKIRVPSGYLYADPSCEENSCRVVSNNGQEFDDGNTFTFKKYNGDKVENTRQYYTIKADMYTAEENRLDRTDFFWKTERNPEDLRLRDMIGLTTPNHSQRDPYGWEIVECE